MESIRVLGVRVDVVDIPGAVETIAELIASGGHHLVATVNPEFIMRARTDRRFAALLESASLCIADGWGVLWASRRLGRPLPERVAGSDLIDPLAERAASAGWRVFLVGAAPGVAAAAAERLRARHPGLLIVGTHAGEPGPEGDAETVAVLAREHPHLLLVAYGAPKQEYWIDRNLAQLPAGVGIGVGGAFDFITGRVPRAPSWMRRAGLEWLFRLLRQPWRARRMAALPRFAIEVMRSAGR